VNKKENSQKPKAAKNKTQQQRTGPHNKLEK